MSKEPVVKLPVPEKSKILSQFARAASAPCSAAEHILQESRLRRHEKVRGTFAVASRRQSGCGNTAKVQSDLCSAEQVSESELAAQKGDFAGTGSFATGSDPRPIGIFDSGVGGLTVLKEVARILPHEDVVYLGDTAHMPYGNKSPDAIIRYALEGASFLEKKGVKLFIVACHTASSHALEILQEKLTVPVIGMIQPGFERLMQATRTLQVGILGTESTIHSGIYQNLIRQHYPKAEVFPLACSLLAPMIEEGLFDHPCLKLMAEHYVGPLKNKVDAVLLACTHYPLIRPLLEQILGNQVRLIEPAETCVLQAREWLVSFFPSELEKNCSLLPIFRNGRHLKIPKDDEHFLCIAKNKIS